MQPPHPKTLADLSALLLQFNADRDWDQFHSPKNLALALSVESAEILELFLWSRDENTPPSPDLRDRLKLEAADVLICLLNLCNRSQIDLTDAFLQKLALNASRYPVEKARGNAKKYDELSSPNPPQD